MRQRRQEAVTEEDRGDETRTRRDENKEKTRRKDKSEENRRTNGHELQFYVSCTCIQPVAHLLFSLCTFSRLVEFLL